MAMQFLRHQQRRIAIAEEAEIVVEGVLIDVTPTVADKGADEQQQRGLRLVEIGDEMGDDFVLVARHNDNLRAGGEHVELVARDPVENGPERAEG